MSISVGIGLAFMAMLCWGFGDFLIQKSTRKIGDWETLFVITLFGAVILMPFVWRDIPEVFLNPGNSSFLILLACGLILFTAALLEFESLKEGKLSVVEPLWSFEVPVAAVLAFLIMGERIDFVQILLIVLLIVGLAMVSFREKYSIRQFLIEKGALISLAAALTMGAANFFMGWGARETDPLMANFFVDLLILIGSGIYLFTKGRIKKVFTDAVKFRGVLLPMSILDNAAWIAFAFAMSLAPIAVAVALSESYIIVAVILGLLINREKIQKHQKFGLIVAIIAAIILAAITG
ncbi:MAG TPA: EamA family transporter [Candidatus Paceibacterota bacterium]